MNFNGKKIKNNKKILTQIRRDQITAAAYKMVSQKGYYDFTILAVAREAGLSTGLILYYFKNKQSLLLNLFKETQNKVRDHLLSELGKVTEPLDKLDVFIGQSFQLFWREKDYFHFLFEFWNQIKRNRAIRQMVQKLYRAYREELSKILQCGVERGIFKEMDIPYTATLCVSIVQHTIIQYLIDEKAFDLDDYATKIKQFIFHWVLKEDPT